MARSSEATNSTAHGNYRHDQAKRRNAPTAETEAVMTDDDRQPKPFSVDRRKIDTPVLVWQREGRTSVLPDEEGGDQIEFEARPLYIREKIDPMALVDQLRRHDEARQGELFGDFNGLPPDADTFHFYEYDGHWQNRLIHGNSMMVMESLINKDGLAGQVQMIYYDPPYLLPRWGKWHRAGKARQITRRSARSRRRRSSLVAQISAVPRPRPGSQHRGQSHHHHRRRNHHNHKRRLVNLFELLCQPLAGVPA